jgi:hypothetical protein
MARVKRIGVLFSAKLQGILWACIGLLAGILYSTIGAVYDVLTVGLNLGTALAFFAIIGMPIIFGTVGFVAGGVGAVLYNLLMKRLGGIEMEVDFEQ